jgi:hypothetical protein
MLLSKRSMKRIDFCAMMFSVRVWLSSNCPNEICAYILPEADLVALGGSASVLSGSLTIDLCSVHTGLSRC